MARVAERAAAAAGLIIDDVSRQECGDESTVLGHIGEPSDVKQRDARDRTIILLADT